MTTFKDIEKSFEAKFAHDEELKFRGRARCNRMLGFKPRPFAAALVGAH